MPASSIGARHRPTILVVGAASRDVDRSDMRGWRLGGGVTYGSMAIARFGMPVRALIGVDREAASARELDLLREAGVDVRLVTLSSGPVFDNRATPTGRLQICHQPSDRLPVDALQATWRDADCAIFSPVAGELGNAWADAFAPSTLVALGWQGLFRRLLARQAVAAQPLVPSALTARADLAVVSAEDALGGGAPLLKLLPRVGQQLVVSHGPLPALHLSRGERGFRMRLLPVAAIDRPRYPVGAGDVLLATWAAASACLRQRNLHADPWRSLAVAMTAAEAKVNAELFSFRL